MLVKCSLQLNATKYPLGHHVECRLQSRGWGLTLASAMLFDCMGTGDAVVHTDNKICVTKPRATEYQSPEVFISDASLPRYTSERRANTER
jgi:hypothetical protein